MSHIPLSESLEVICCRQCITSGQSSFSQEERPGVNGVLSRTANPRMPIETRKHGPKRSVHRVYGMWVGGGKHECRRGG